MLPIIQERRHCDILNVFAEEKAREHGFLRVSAPMVRYSKLEFRKLLRQNDVKLCFTPMIIADSFNNSQKARENEFTTLVEDQPIIAQFAARNANEFVKAAQLIYPYVDGIDLNCGCPQSWAISKGYGCGLLRQPELVRDIIKTVRRVLPQEFSVSLKIRLLNGDSVRSTVEFARQLEKCGVTFLTLHGRTMWQRPSDPLNVLAMADIKQSLEGMPLIANGNVRSWKDACELHTQTNADGIMVARGLLSNPTLFNLKVQDQTAVPLECVQQWLDISARAADSLQFQCFHHHLIFMCGNQMSRKLRLEFNSITQKQEVFRFFKKHFNIEPSSKTPLDPFQYTKCTYSHFSPPEDQFDIQSKSSRNLNGKYFNEFNEELENQRNYGLEGSFFADLI